MFFPLRIYDGIFIRCIHWHPTYIYRKIYIFPRTKKTYIFITSFIISRHKVFMATISPLLFHIKFSYSLNQILNFTVYIILITK